MSATKIKNQLVKVLQNYEAPRFESLTVETEFGIAAGSGVAGTGMQQEVNEENQSHNVEW